MMNLIQFLRDVINERCPGYLLVTGWCFFAMVVMVEIFLPVAFGYMMTYPVEVVPNQWLEISTGLFYIFDKMGILLGAFCAASSYMEIVSWRKGKEERE